MGRGNHPVLKSTGSQELATARLASDGLEAAGAGILAARHAVGVGLLPKFKLSFLDLVQLQTCWWGKQKPESGFAQWGQTVGWFRRQTKGNLNAHLSNTSLHFVFHRVPRTVATNLLNEEHHPMGISAESFPLDGFSRYLGLLAFGCLG